MKYKAQILVETIIGVGVVGLLLAAIIPLFIVGIKAGPEAWKSDTAWMLANELVEGANAVKRDNWNNIYQLTKSSPYHSVNNAGTWQLVAGAENLTINNLQFSRQIVIDNVSRTGLNGAGELETSYNPARDDPSTQKITVTVTWPSSSGLTLVDYLTRFQNSTWVQTSWTGGAGQVSWNDQTKYFSHTTVANPPNPDIDNTAGNLRLAQIPAPGNLPFGNQFITSATTSQQILPSANQRLSLRFTAQKNGNVDRLRFYIHSQNQGNKVTYRYGLQNDDPLNPGFPSGNYINNIYATASIGSTGWQEVTLPSAVAVSAGNVYHFVIGYDSGQQNRSISLRQSTPLNPYNPYSMAADTAINSLFYNAGAWAVQNREPIFVLRYDDLTFEGNPYDNFSSLGVYGANNEGETFTLTSNRNITGVALYVRTNANIPNQLPQDSLYLTLTNLTDSIDLITNEVFLAPDQVSGSFKWESHQFASTLNLLANHQYRLFFTSPGTSNARRYLVNNVTNVANSADYNGLTWNGTGSFASHTPPATSNNADLSYYLILSSGLQYAPKAILVSSSFDTGNPQGGGFNRLFWQATTENNITFVEFQLAANNNNSSWDINNDFKGPDGTTATWYQATDSNKNIYSGLSGNRYLRYKVRLRTIDQSKTPTLNWVRINWSY